MYYYGQRFIKINRQNVMASKSTGRLYLIAYYENLKNAMLDLSASAFKCYLTLMMNKDKFIIDYSPQYISTVSNLSKQTVRKALKELAEKGYLIQVDQKNYNFYEYPHLFKTKKKEQRKTIIDRTTGEVFHYTYNELRQFVSEQNAKLLWEDAEIYEQE